MISVIIPAFNEEKYLASTIESVRKNKHPVYEIIVVCNGCSDNTESVARELADRVIVLEESGVSYARNEGAKAAKYETLVFLDADTRITPHALEAVSKCPGFGTLAAGSDTGLLKDKIFFLLKRFNQNFVTSSGVVFCSKALFNKVGGFSVGMTKFEDTKFLRRAHKYEKYYVLSEKSFTSTRRYQKYGYLGTVLYWLKEYFFPSEDIHEPVR